VLKTLISEVEEEVAGRAGKTHDPLIGLLPAVTIRVLGGHLLVKTNRIKNFTTAEAIVQR